MSDLVDLSTVSGNELSLEQIQGILNQIDLDVMNLVRDGKLSALKYGVGASAKASVDRGANLAALLKARSYYEGVLSRMKAASQEEGLGCWEVNEAEFWRNESP